MTNTTSTNMRKGFTMIELIFVIVIIGILAAVAIPKLAASKDDATAATCQHELGQIVTEIAGAYTASSDFTTWTGVLLDDVTNISTNIGATGLKGIVEDGSTIAVHANDWTFNCDGEPMATIKTEANSAGDYQLTVSLETPSTPSNIKAVAAIKKQYNGNNSKTYTF